MARPSSSSWDLDRPVTITTMPTATTSSSSSSSSSSSTFLADHPNYQDQYVDEESHLIPSRPAHGTIETRPLWWKGATKTAQENDEENDTKSNSNVCLHLQNDHPRNHNCDQQHDNNQPQTSGSIVLGSITKVKIIAASVAAYWALVSLIPIYNKFYFQLDKYPFPIATAAIQLFVVAMLLFSYSILQHYRYCRENRHQRYSHCHSSASSSTPPPSWILGPHFWFKLKWCLPVGIAFGFKYGVTNLGLHLVPTSTHLLLQSTDLVWTVLGAWIFNGELIKARDWWCVLGCIGGSVVLSWDHWSLSATSYAKLEGGTAAANDPGTESTPSFGAVAVLINLLSPILLGLCISTLRLACTHLMLTTDNNCLRGAVVSAVELTSLKLVVASLVAALLASFMEPTWWHAFWVLDASTKCGVLGGALLIALFQVNCTALTYLTNTVTVGLVGQVKIIPQWIVAAIFAMVAKDASLQHGPNIVGALLILLSAAAFCYSNYRSSN